MSNLAPWVLAERPWSPAANLAGTRIVTSGAMYRTDGWSINLIAGQGATSICTTSNSTPYPWIGQANLRMTQQFMDVDPRWLMSYVACGDYLPAMFENAVHSLRASIRLLPLTNTCSGIIGILAPGSGFVVGTNLCQIAYNQFGFFNRHQNSWQMLTTDLITYGGSVNIHFFLFVPSGFTTVDVVMADLRFYLNEIEIYQHADQEVSRAAEEGILTAQGGARYRTALSPRRRWTLPVEFLVESQWTRLESWYLSGAKLWLGAPSLEAWYPVVMTDQKQPAGKLHPGSIELRGGEITLESDYTEDLHGPFHKEPLP